jgi:hypothetical protein
LFDVTQAYQQVEVEQDSIPLTSFVCNVGQFENVFMPFGLKNASAIFQRCIDNILRPHQDVASSYIDDIITKSKGSFDDHIEQLDRVLSTLEKSGMTLKLSKCQFGKKKVKFLGFIIGNGEKDPDTGKLLSFQDVKEPTTKKAVRSLLAMCRYYKAHLKDFSRIAAPLADLTKNRVSATFVLNDEQRRAFEEIKKCMREAQRTYSPDYNRKFIVSCDASDIAIAGILSQIDDQGIERPIEFISKKLTESQKNWAIIMREAYAILYCLQQWDHYIFGSEVDVITDHNPLKYLVQCAPNSPKLLRWSLGLQRWNLNIKHRKGSDHVAADFFSRYA